MKFQSRITACSSKLAFVAFIACIVSCKDSASTNQPNQFNPVGEWCYPLSGNPDSTLSSFLIKLWTPDSAKFLGYLNGDLLDSTTGTWKYQNESLFVALSKCVKYGFELPTSPSSTDREPCIDQIKFSNDGDYLLDNTGKRYKRK